MKLEIRGFKDVLEHVHNEDTIDIENKENNKLTKNSVRFDLSMTPKAENTKSMSFTHDFSNKFILKCNNFSIIPPKITSTLIEFKTYQLKLEHKLRNKLILENEMLDTIKSKNEEINDLKEQLKYNKPNMDSMTLSVNEDDALIEQSIRDKLYQLENENIELKSQLNQFLAEQQTNDLNKIEYRNQCNMNNACVICPLVDSIIYLVNRLPNDDLKIEKNFNEDSESIEIAQRIVIKSLTNTLAKLINENDLSNLNIEEFVPTQDDDKTAWYLDLLETQLKFAKDLSMELKDYYESLKTDQNYDNSKQLKAVYYELASNTRSVSDQVKNIYQTLSLIKHDVSHKSPRIEDRTATLQLLTEISTPDHQSDNYKQIGHLKNELCLANKVKKSLEKQLEQYNKLKVRHNLI